MTLSNVSRVAFRVTLPVILVILAFVGRRAYDSDMYSLVAQFGMGLNLPPLLPALLLSNPHPVWLSLINPLLMAGFVAGFWFYVGTILDNWIARPKSRPAVSKPFWIFVTVECGILVLSGHAAMGLGVWALTWVVVSAYMWYAIAT